MAPARPTRWWRGTRFNVAAGAVALLGLAILAGQRFGWFLVERVDPVQLTRIAGEPESEVGAIFSPDGETLAYLRGAQP